MERVQFQISEYPSLEGEQMFSIQEPFTLESGHTMLKTVLFCRGFDRLNKWLSKYGTVGGYKHWKEVVLPRLGNSVNDEMIWEFLDHQ